MKRFAIMAVLGALACGSLVAGCGGNNADDESGATAGNVTAGNLVMPSTPGNSTGNSVGGASNSIGGGAGNTVGGGAGASKVPVPVTK